MREVVGRYFRRRVDEKKPLPDLVVIDGGKGQLGAAADALRELGLDTLQLISLAKREEEIYVVGRADPIRLSRRSPGLRMLAASSRRSASLRRDVQPKAHDHCEPSRRSC